MKKIILIITALTTCFTAWAQSEEATSAGSTATIKPQPIEPIASLSSPLVVDTIATDNAALSIVLFNDNTWRYIRNHNIECDSTSFTKYWDTENISAYKEVELNHIPKSVAINLTDSVCNYRYPHIGRITSRYGVRWRRNHNGIDLALKVGDTICSTFDGRVRFSKCTNTGYGTLVIVRHDNGLETYHGHLSKRLVEEGERVVAGQPIGLGGNSGKSTGPHLHFECRYMGQSFDPERIIDFKTGKLRRDALLLRRSYFSIHSRYEQDFNDENEMYAADKKEHEASAERRYYKVRSGDNLGLIAKRHHTTVGAICRLNGIKSTSVLKIGKVLRVK